MKSNLSIFLFMNHAFGIKSKNSLPDDFLLRLFLLQIYNLHLSLWLTLS